MWKKFNFFRSFLLSREQERKIRFAPTKITINDSVLDIRKAEPKGIAALVGLEKSLYQGQTPWTMSVFQGELTKVNALYIVVAHSNILLAVIGIRFNRSEAHVTILMVDSAWQKLGLGTYLMNLAIDIAKNKKCKELSLEVRADNLPAQNLYQKLGFVVTFIWPNYYQDSHQNGLNMVLKLTDD